MESENPDIKGGITTKIRDSRVRIREVTGWA